MPFLLENIPDPYRIYDARHLTFGPHLHRHIEIVFLKSCEKSVAFAGNKSAILETGDIFISFPEQPHHYNDFVRYIDAKILLVSPDLCPEYNNIFENCIPDSPVIKNAVSYPFLINSFNAIYERMKNGTENKNFIRGCVLVLLNEIFNITKLEKSASQTPDITQKIITYCHEHYALNISLQDIADEFNFNRCYVSQIFNKRLNISFTEYINSLRLHAACELLTNTSKSITDICFEVGFNSIRSFNRCFAKIYRITPHEYRTQNLKKESTETL